MPSESTQSSVRFRVLAGIGYVGLVVWAAWWLIAYSRGKLPFARRLWFEHPALGADFWSEADMGARSFHDGIDPYANEIHLFHYPPIVIRLFLWVHFFDVLTATKIWIVVLSAIMIAGTFAALRTRRELAADPIPAPFALAALLLSLPAVFTLERGNWDLITLAAMVAALPLLRSEHRLGAFAAGCLLVVGPWVKIYPGLIGLGLLALRRYRAFVGFVVGGVLIGASMWKETMRSFEVLQHQIRVFKISLEGAPYFPWSHSIPTAWTRIAEVVGGEGGAMMAKVPAGLVSLTLLGPVLTWVCYRVYRTSNNATLVYPMLLWIVSLSTFVPEIANDYNFVFMPLATIAVVCRRDTRFVLGSIAVAMIVWQPFGLRIPSLLTLLIKLVWLHAVGVSLVARAHELDELVRLGLQQPEH